MKKSFFFSSFIAVLLLLLASCSSNPFGYSEDTPYIVQPLVLSNIKDGRGDFYREFCGRVEAACADYLFYSHPESLKGSHGVKLEKQLKARYRLVVIPGIFGECLGTDVLPFMYAATDLEQKYSNIRVSVLTEINGRASAEHNATVIDRYLSTVEVDSNEKLIIIAYSKGMTDTLYYLSEHFTGKPTIDAVVSIAGVVNGTPVADKFENIGNRLSRYLSIDECEEQDDSGISSLTLKKQMQWLETNGGVFSKNINMYSLVTASKPKNTSLVFKQFHKYLYEYGGVNDGQVHASSQIIPASTLLGYVNADHWAVILPFDQTALSSLSLPNKIVKKFANKNSFPREELLESILFYLDKYQ